MFPMPWPVNGEYGNEGGDAKRLEGDALRESGGRRGTRHCTLSPPSQFNTNEPPTLCLILLRYFP